MGNRTDWIKVTIVNDENVIINTFVGTTEKVIEELESAIAATKMEWVADPPSQEGETHDAQPIDDPGEQPEQQQGDETEETPADAKKTKESNIKRPFPWA